MSEHVRARTDGANVGWWCDLHKRFTGLRGWCPECDESDHEDGPA